MPKAERKAKNKTRILVLDHDDPEREFQFELEWLMSLTSKQRYEMMLRLSIDGLKRMIRHGHLKPFEIRISKAHGKRRSQARGR